MNQTDTDIGAPSTDSKSVTNIETAMAAAKARKDKAAAKGAAKPAPKQGSQAAPARSTVMPGQRDVVTFETAARICPNAAVIGKIVQRFGYEDVEYHAIREATEEHLVRSAKVLADNLGERFEKPLDMHMQRIVDGFVRSAHGAGQFYDRKAKEARDATSGIANPDRDEDRPGIDGTENRAQRACHFAAVVALQAYAVLAAAQGAVDAYAQVCGRDWKPYEGNQAPGQSLTRQAIKMQADAFSRD